MRLQVYVVDPSESDFQGEETESKADVEAPEIEVVSPTSADPLAFGATEKKPDYPGKASP